MNDLENLARDVIFNWDFSSCVNLARCLRSLGHHTINSILCSFFLDKLGINVDLLDELGMALWNLKAYQQSFEIYSKALKIPDLTEDKLKHLVFNQHFSGEQIYDKHTLYNKSVVDKIVKNQNENSLITFTMTTCKRTDLFYKTINSFLNCVQDLHLIGDWYIIDDNTPSHELDTISKLYPFLKIIRKTPSQKGHPASMNLIKKMVKTPFLFHMEDDWMFYRKLDYLTQCLDVLTSNRSYGQCLVNINYSELPSDSIPGGFFKKTVNGTKYYEHEYYQNLPEKFLRIPNCAYWPHFSFRPSLINTKIFKQIGDFNAKVGHFEMEYAYRYISHGFISCFLPFISSKHTGRLTSERNDKSKPNAYELNGEDQFVKNQTNPKLDRIKNYVINLDRRQDRWKEFTEKTAKIPLTFTRKSAVDGKTLSPTRQMLQLFDTNDYNYRRGMVGCALSHLKIMIELVYDTEYDAYLVLEDDIDFCDGFFEKYNKIVDELYLRDDWGLAYLGHTPHPPYQKTIESDDPAILEKIATSESLKRSMGGAFGYLINKKGAIAVLEYIGKMGMTNAVDTMQQKSGDDMGGIYYSIPNLVFAKVAYQSDIQNYWENLYVDDEGKLELEKKALDSKNIQYKILDKQIGAGWWIGNKYKYISISILDIDKIADLKYTNRLKKIVGGKIIYSVDDCIK